MTLLRLSYGIIYGLSLPLTTSMMCEITPMSIRGKLLIIINFFVSVGKMFGVIIAFICLKNFNEGNWRLMFFISSLPSIAVFFGSIFIIKESARWLVAK